MKKKFDLNKRWNSTPIVNYINSTSNDNVEKIYELQEFLLEHMMFNSVVSKMKINDYVIKRLGKHIGTFTGEFRYLVWEGKDWRCYSANRKGISIEVRNDLTIEDAISAYEDFINVFGQLTQQEKDALENKKQEWRNEKSKN